MIAKSLLRANHGLRTEYGSMPQNNGFKREIEHSHLRSLKSGNAFVN